jgi:crotonobetainyl-CoA:carnitine CoA-transferase CaiB-like acyl-CoA transferase
MGERIFEDLLVVDLTTFVTGGFATPMLANQGRSVELDLEHEAGLAALYDLVGEADVFVQNFRAGTAERLGVDEDSIREHSEDVVYCAISSAERTAPSRRRRPGSARTPATCSASWGTTRRTSTRASSAVRSATPGRSGSPRHRRGSRPAQYLRG